jgi:hypothetical protein
VGHLVVRGGVVNERVSLQDRERSHKLVRREKSLHFIKASVFLVEIMNSFIVQTKNGQAKWNLDSACRKVVTPIAHEFGMSAKRFLELYSRHRLPGQLVRSRRLDEERAPAGFSVTLCEESSIQKRIRRAARFAGFSVKDFVWRALASSVNSCEDDMILSPKTGRPLAHDVELEHFIMKRELVQ